MPDKTNLIVCRVLFTSLRLRQATSHPWHVLARETDRKKERVREESGGTASAGNYGATSRVPSTTPSPSPSTALHAARHLTNMAKSGQTIGLAWAWSGPGQNMHGSLHGQQYN